MVPSHERLQSVRVSVLLLLLGLPISVVLLLIPRLMDTSLIEGAPLSLALAIENSVCAWLVLMKAAGKSHSLLRVVLVAVDDAHRGVKAQAGDFSATADTPARQLVSIEVVYRLLSLWPLERFIGACGV